MVDIFKVSESRRVVLGSTGFSLEENNNEYSVYSWYSWRVVVVVVVV